MTDIFEKNMNMLSLKIVNFKTKYEKWNDAYTDEKVFMDKSLNDEIIIGVEKDSRKWYLNSRYEARKAAIKWAEGFEDIHYKSVFLICGIANGMYVEELVKKTGEDNIIIVYEPETEIFIKLMQNRDLTSLFSTQRVFYFIENINMEFFRPYFREIVKYEIVNFSKLKALPNYGKIYANEFEEFNELCNKEANYIQGEKNTLVDLGKEMIINEIKNLWKVLNISTINKLKEKFSENVEKIEDLPAIIVSAGPSLDKNIYDLKNAKNKAFIIATDSAIKRLVAADIIPDVVVTVDSHKPVELFANPRVREIPMVLCSNSVADVFENYNAQQFTFATDEYLMKFYEEENSSLDTLQTGGCVANDAFSLAVYIGMKNIILIGQDLAFTDNKKHVSNTYKEAGISEEEEYLYTYCEGMNGEKLLTYKNFVVYRQWFESEIKDHEDLNVINATEGGALIKGATQMTLKDAIETYCKFDYDSSFINKVPNEFNEEQLERIKNKILATPKRCDELCSRFEQGIRDYRKLKQLVSTGKMGNSEFRNVLKKIEEVNGLGTKEILIDVISKFSKGDEYEVLEGMYKDVTDDTDDLRQAAQHGIKLLESYIKATKEIKELYLALIENDFK